MQRLQYTIKAAKNIGHMEEVQARIRDLVASESSGESLVTKIIGRELRQHGESQSKSR